MTDDRYDKVTFRGVTVDKFTRAALLVVEKELGYELTLWQGSYHKGVTKSAGTHDGGGVVDLAGDYDVTNKVKALRRNGFVADWRNQPSLSNEIHAVQIGNTKASKSAKAQIAPMERGRAGLAVDVPQVIKYTPPGGYKEFAYKPVPKVDPRPKAGAPWFKIATFNMKAPSLTTSGAHKWTARRQGQVASIASLHTDVLCVQEAGSGTDLSWLDSHLKPHGLKRVPKGGNWRHIYISDLPEIVASGSFELTPLYNKDTKEAAWAVLKIGSQRVLVTSFHLESDSAAAADPIRVKQATSLVTQGAVTAKKYDVSPERIFHAGDSNSQGLVASAMKGHGFVSADVNAWKSTNTTFATINNWINKRKGGHEDYIFVPAKRPVLTWTQKVNAIISDHNALLAQIAAIA